MWYSLYKADYNIGISLDFGNGTQNVIFITEKDFFKHGLPVYHIERSIKELDEPFNDGSHIIYVNADDMYYPTLAEKVRYYKENEEGVKVMCKIMDDVIRAEKAKMINEMMNDNVPKKTIARYCQETIEVIEEIIKEFSLPKVAL